MPTPSAPSNVILQTGNGQNLVSWNLSIGATSYSIQRSVDGISFVSVGTATTNTYLDTSVVVGTSYWYQVASVGVGGTSAYTACYPASTAQKR